MIETITSAFNTLKFLSDQKQVKTKLLVDPAELRYFEEIFGDENRYEQLFLNFISNAIKFTRPGTFVEVILSANQLSIPKTQDSDIYSKNMNENMIRTVEEFARRQHSQESSTEFIYASEGDPKIFEANESIKKEIKNNDDTAFINFSIKIKDYGEGISKDEIKNLFVDF